MVHLTTGSPFPDSAVCLSVRGLTRRFPGVLALDSVSFEITSGEVVAVVGENGAGKSTLVNVLAGSMPPDAGEVVWLGRPVRWSSPREAALAGVSVVHQELSLFPHLSVTENMELGRLRGLCNWPGARRSAAERLARIGLAADDRLLNRRAGELPLATAQLVEIARAASHDCRLLVLDEPTSALSDDETAHLFRVIRDLCATGVAVLFISHRLVEVFAVSSRIVVLKDGRKVGELMTAEVTQPEVVRLMVGRQLAPSAGRRGVDEGPAPPHLRHSTAPILALDNWTLPGGRPFTVEFAAGQIVGIGGLADSGKDELLLSLIGEAPATGSMLLGGRPCRPASAADARGHGIGYLPADRKEAGILPGLAVLDNLLVESRTGVSLAGFLKRVPRLEAYHERRGRFDIRAASPHMPIRNLSGGNQQKCLLSRVLETAPRVILIDEPTRGVDVGAREEIHRVLRALAGSGSLVVIASSEVSELHALSDRILIVRDRALAADLERREATEESISTALIHHAATAGPAA